MLYRRSSSFMASLYSYCGCELRCTVLYAGGCKSSDATDLNPLFMLQFNLKLIVSWVLEETRYMKMEIMLVLCSQSFNCLNSKSRDNLLPVTRSQCRERERGDTLCRYCYCSALHLRKRRQKGKRKQEQNGRKISFSI